MMNRFGAICICVGIALFTGCGGDKPKQEDPKDAPAAQQGQAARVVEVTLAFIEPRFRPDPIEIKAGEPVQFKVSSADTRHHFVIEPLGIDVEVPPKSMSEGVTTKVVTPKEAGTFRIFCSVHARLKMEGKLVVTEAK